MKILIALVIGIVVFMGAAVGVVFLLAPSHGDLAVQELAEPLNEARTCSLDLDLAEGTLSID